MDTTVVEKILILVENHGLALVMIFLFLYWGKKAVDFLSPYIGKMFDKSLGNNNAPANKYKRLIELSDQIDKMLDAVLMKYDSDRVTVFEFHNGGKSIIGCDFMKKSITHEVTSVGTRHIIQTIQSIPVSLHGKWNRVISSGEIVRCPSIDCVRQKDYSLWASIVDRGTKSIYEFPLDENGIVFGALCVEFCKKEVILNEEQINDIRNQAARISGFYSQARSDIGTGKV